MQPGHAEPNHDNSIFFSVAPIEGGQIRLIMRVA